MGLVVLGEDLHAHNIDWGKEGIGMGSEEREGRTVGSEGGDKQGSHTSRWLGAFSDYIKLQEGAVMYGVLEHLHLKGLLRPAK